MSEEKKQIRIKLMNDIYKNLNDLIKELRYDDNDSDEKKTIDVELFLACKGLKKLIAKKLIKDRA